MYVFLSDIMYLAIIYYSANQSDSQEKSNISTPYLDYLEDD